MRKETKTFMWSTWCQIPFLGRKANRTPGHGQHADSGPVFFGRVCQAFARNMPLRAACCSEPTNSVTNKWDTRHMSRFGTGSGRMSLVSSGSDCARYEAEGEAAP